MTTFNSMNDLNKFIGATVRLVIYEVSEKIAHRLEENINIYTYHYDYFPNKVYYKGEYGNALPTFQFRDSWTWHKVKSQIHRYTRAYYQDIAKMQKAPHSRKGNDIRKDLAKSLNVDGMFGNKMRKPYWDITLNELFNEGMIAQWFEEAFAKRGIYKWKR